MLRTFRFGVILLAVLGPAATLSQAQGDRRERNEPGLILDTEGRTGACDALVFTPDGQYLLAAGDDKVVFLWKVGEKGLTLERKLRWGIYREQRGVIYALDFWPRQKGKAVKQIAIAGIGRQNGTVAVFDLDKEPGQELERVLPYVEGNDTAIWSLAFSPSGKRIAFGAADGNVWLWNLDTPTDDDARRLGPRGPASSTGRVHYVAFSAEEKLTSVAADGQVRGWSLDKPAQKPELMFKFGIEGVRRVALSPDGKWLVALGAGDSGLEIRSFPDGKGEEKLPPLPARHYPQCLAFDPSGRTLAVGVRVRAAVGFLHDVGGTVKLFDLESKPGKKIASLETTLYADATAFSPDGKHLAIAGGNDNEVTLWNIQAATPVKVAEARSPGSGLWKVAFSQDGSALGFQDHRADKPEDPNHRGASHRKDAPYRVFDLKRLDWSPRPADFRPYEPAATEAGWSVEYGDAFRWYVIHPPTDQRYELELLPSLDAEPRCYTFLKATKEKPIRLAVGHYWGVSLFEIDPRRAMDAKDKRVKMLPRTRLYVGHQGYVTSVAASPDEKLLVSASRDQTINVWSLADWPQHAELGASFEVKGEKLVVKAVDPGSPGWQAGLGKDAKVTLLKETTGGFDDADGDAAVWKRKIESAQPREILIFEIRKRGEAVQKQQVSLRQRPLWRFFPTRAGEWVLWRWQDYFYDSSTHGDAYIGWQISGERVEDRPIFYSAERLRNSRNRPDKVKKILADMRDAPDRIQFRDIEPPAVACAAPATVKDAKVTVKLSAEPRDKGDLQKLTRVELWVNDYRVKEWFAADLKEGTLPATPVEIPPADLRLGDNTIVVHAFNKADACGEARTVVTFTSALPVGRPILYGLCVGVSDYTDVAPGTKALTDIRSLNSAHLDAQSIHKLLLAQKNGKLYSDVEVGKPLTNRDATPKAIKDRIQAISKKAKPEDLFVLFLAGHGYEDADKMPGNFVFVGPLFDHTKVRETCLTSKDLYDSLAELRCHKLILLDSCHSGLVATNPLRDLRRNGIGPVILTACAPKQTALEDPSGKNGLFTSVLLEAFKDPKADVNADGIIDAGELVRYVVEGVPGKLSKYKKDKEWLEKLDVESKETIRKHEQNPEVSPRIEEVQKMSRPVAAKP